jgi:hypothetical protein
MPWCDRNARLNRKEVKFEDVTQDVERAGELHHKASKFKYLETQHAIGLQNWTVRSPKLKYLEAEQKAKRKTKGAYIMNLSVVYTQEIRAVLHLIILFSLHISQDDNYIILGHPKYVIICWFIWVFNLIASIWRRIRDCALKIKCVGDFFNLSETTKEYFTSHFF